MNSRISQIALRIALIEEEFTQEEIDSAVALIEKHGTVDSLLKYLASGNRASNPDKPSTKRPVKPINEQCSPAVAALEQSEPEKFEVLSRMDQMIRRGVWLPQLDDIRRLSGHLSKNFVSKKSRREAINQLLSLIAARSIDEIKRIETDMPSYKSEKSNGYRNLAHYIVTGESISQQNRSH